MPTTRPLGQSFLVLLSGFTLVACVATPGPIAESVAPSAAPSVATPSSVPSDSPRPIASTVASASPSEEPGPTDPPDPTPEPTLSPIAGCGTGEAGFLAHGRDGPETLRFGGATLEFTPAGTGMRDGSYDVDDAIPSGVGLTADEIAVAVGPSDHIILRGADVTILDTQAAAVPWSAVTFDGGLADLAGPRIPLAWRARDDGSLSISAPDQIGDWAVEFVPRWQSDCVKGDGTAYGRIKVR
jgi:hypothetical protein